jgi:predicted GIY-YIG superfamily endonuclease
MTDYSLAKIYKIIDNTNNNIYIGSTCEPTLARRLAKHLGNYKHYLKTKNCSFTTSFDIIKETYCNADK